MVLKHDGSLTDICLIETKDNENYVGPVNLLFENGTDYKYAIIRSESPVQDTICRNGSYSYARLTFRFNFIFLNRVRQHS